MRSSASENPGSLLSVWDARVERATERLLALDEAPNADIYAAYDALSRGEAAGVWDFEEAHVGHQVRRSRA